MQNLVLQLGTCKQVPRTCNGKEVVEEEVAQPAPLASALRCDICRKSPKDCKWSADSWVVTVLSYLSGSRRMQACSQFAFEEVDWAKVNKKTGEAVECRCKLCMNATRAAFPGMSWESILAKAKVNTAFKQQLAEAIRTKAGGTVSCTPEDVTNSTVVGYLVEREYHLFSEKEFTDIFGMKPGEAGLLLETFKDERGEDMKGVVLDDGYCKRKIRLQCMCSIAHSELLHQHQHQHQLRDQQGKDVMDLWTEDLNKCGDRPRALRGHKPLTVEAAQAQVKAKRERQAAEEAEKQRLAALAAEAGIVEEQPQEEEEEKEEEEEEPLLDLQLDGNDDDDGEFKENATGSTFLLPSQRAGKGKSEKGKKTKGKGKNKKGKGKGKGTGKSKQKGSTSTPTLPSAVQGGGGLRLEPQTLAGQGAAASSAADDRDGDAQSVMTARASVDKYIASVDLSKILAGESLGDKLYQCKRQLLAIERTHGECTDLVTLRGHYQLAMRCQD
eukprot:1026139-Amphidinium_carterae.2